MPDADRETDVIVIGGGPAGYVAAIRATQLDLAVTLVERERVGGSCLNHGCIPSKALISATDLAHRVREAGRMGIDGDPDVDVGQLVSWKDRIVTRLTRGVEGLCEGNGVVIESGTGQFVDAHHVRVSAPDRDEPVTIRFEHGIIATGSRPIELPALPFEEPGIWDSRQALAVDAAPDRLAVVGAGYIGMELAAVFAKLGTDVTVIELLEQALVRYDSRATEIIVERMEGLGVEFRLGQQVTDVERTAEDRLSLTVTEQDDEPTPAVTANAVLVAVGREPVSDTLALDAAGLAPAEDGTIETDAAGRTPVDHLFAVGDVTGDPMLAHAGMAEGVVASETIAGEAAATDPHAVPEVVFTDPELARVGLDVAGADEAGYEPIVGEFPLRASGRAMTTGQTDGHVRVIADEETEQILGGRIVGPEASELIAEIGLAVETEATLSTVGETIHAHPTLAESVKEACELALGRPMHVLDR